MGLQSPTRSSSSFFTAKPLVFLEIAMIDPFFGSALTGAAGIVSGWMSAEQSADNTAANIEAQMIAGNQARQFNEMEAHRARQFNEAEALKNRQFQSSEVEKNRQYQTQMSNTAYQRAMEDMKSAGLNPILAYQRGGATTPTGGAASGSQASGPAASTTPQNMAFHNTRSPFEGLGDVVGKMVNTAVSLKAFDKMTEEIANIQADTAKRKAEEVLTVQRTGTETRETIKREHEAEQAGLRTEHDRRRNEEEQAIRKLPSWMRDLVVQWAYGGSKTGEGLEPLVSSARGLRNLFPQRSTVERTTTDTRGHGSSTFEERFKGGF